MKEKNIQRLHKGLNTDVSPVDQPKDTLRFALNAVKETNNGDIFFLSPEESNSIYYEIGLGFIPIGKINLTNNRIVIFLVKQNISKIILLEDNNEYRVLVDDFDSENKLNFSVNYQIEGTYRLRKGCEDTIYFTDDYNEVRYFNLHKDYLFKTDGKWDAKKFSLKKAIKKQPKILDINIIKQGSLEPGSYSVFLQYLDEDLNGSEFTEIINNINIVNDNLTDNYSDIHGSINLENEAYKYGNTSKAIKINLTNLDNNFYYYRYAFVHYTSGNGEPTKVIYTNVISVNNSTFIYTGTNGLEEGDIQDIIFFNKFLSVKTAKNIIQTDNRLVLSNIKGEDIKLCRLQKYASKIKSDCFIKDIVLTNIEDKHNPKNPLVKYNGTGYMPGEVYSFGIVYIFEDNTESPVYHIPGKSELSNNLDIFSSGENTYPMSNINNSNVSEFYNENDSCDSESYWGKDYLGNTLERKNIRHHRFPSREDINIGFVEKLENDFLNTTSYKKIILNLNGEIKESVICFYEDEDEDENCESYDAPIYTLTVKYLRNGVEEEFSDTIYPDSIYKTRAISSDTFLIEDDISDIRVFYKEVDSNTEEEIVLEQEYDNGITYTIRVGNLETDNTSNQYKVPIFGLKLSNIEIPSEEEIGKKIIGYKIVRQERTDSEKTILDTGVILPTIKNKKFVASSILTPEWDNCEVTNFEEYENNCNRASRNNVMLLTPEHKFQDKTFDSFSTIEQVGEYQILRRNATAFTVQDIMEGTSASDNERKPQRDNDGFSLKHTIRENVLRYNKVNSGYKISNENTTIFNLEGLSWAETKYEGETLYNLSSDNKSLFISNDDGENITPYEPGQENIPYVIIKRNLNTFYQNFRTSEYYSVDNEIHTESEVIVFGGDSYVTPLRYTNHIFLNAVAAYRRQKANVWQIIGSALAIVVGVLITIATAGTGTLATIGTIGGILTALSGVVMGAATFIEQAKFKEIYAEKWYLGLDKTVYDKFIKKYFYNSQNGKFFPMQWRDDTLKWHGEILSDIWFETSINMSLRVKPINHSTNNLDPLKKHMTHRDDKLPSHYDFIDNYPDRYFDVTDKGVEGTEENYFYKKITVPDTENKSKDEYTGVSIPTIYMLNPDHNIKTNLKKYYPLPLEYDCCSKCAEDFPHRWMWSEQSFQEELTDNYRTFLFNNYKDITGETGEITNMFTLGNDLYLQTYEALFKIPRNYQERITDQLVTYIGTGSYGELPEQKISDAGCTHKWSFLKTPYGVFYISEIEKDFYYFDGSKVNPISSKDLSSWFRKNIPLIRDNTFLKNNNIKYPYYDNPSNDLGTGFITIYDPKYDRIILTKKDFILDDSSYYNYELCNNGQNILFNNISNIIRQKEQEGWSYLGIENCQMKFSKEVIKTREETVLVESTISNNTDIHVFFDTSGSFGGTNATVQQIENGNAGACFTSINTAIENWIDNFNIENPDWSGQIYKHVDATEGWVNYANIIAENIYNGQTQDKDILVISFCNESQANGGVQINYHPNTLTPIIPTPTQDFLNHRDNFINNIYPNYKSFKGIHYPVVFGNNSFNCINSNNNGNNNASKVFLLHSIAAVEGIITNNFIQSLEKNPGFTDAEWDMFLTALRGTNYYPENGLKNYGWLGKWDRACINGQPIINAEQFNEDIKNLLESFSVYEEETRIVTYTEVEYDYVDGTIVEIETINNSWTISYSLKDKTWVSWHSYLPSFYFRNKDTFFSWVKNKRSFWKHNMPYNYRTFYSETYPYILEYVILTNPLQNNLVEHLRFQINSQKYDKKTETFVEDLNDIFDKIILYNSRQCSGLIEVNIKDEESVDFFSNQTQNSNEVSKIDKNERDWTINDYRDIRIDYTKPIWIKDLEQLQEKYFIDKVLNEDTLNNNKEWTDLEPFRDKYLVVRIIFDKFVNNKYIINYVTANEHPSFK